MQGWLQKIRLWWQRRVLRAAIRRADKRLRARQGIANAENKRRGLR